MDNEQGYTFDTRLYWKLKEILCNHTPNIGYNESLWVKIDDVLIIIGDMTRED